MMDGSYRVRAMPGTAQKSHFAEDLKREIDARF
jgi:hypothetical protein